MNLNQDYDWARVIGKRDSLLMQSMEDDISQVILDYLGVENDEDVSKEHVEELLEIRKFLETPLSEGDKGFTLSGSPHFEVLYNSIQMLADEILEEVEGVSQEAKIDNINKQPNQPPEINLDDELMWDEIIDEMIEEDKDKKD